MGRLALCLSLLTLISAIARAQTVNLTPDKDNTLVQTSSGNLSDGAGDAIYAGRTGQGTGSDIRRGLLHFNLSSIPAGATVTSASLRLVAENVGQNGDRSMTLHKILEDWGQGTSNARGRGATATTNDATWLYRFYVPSNPTSSPKWTTTGGSFSATSSASAICPNLGGPFTFTGNSTSQIVADIRAWLADPSTNFGWELSGIETSGSTAKRIYSREYFTVASRPTLTITYAVPEPSSLLLHAIIASLIVSQRHFRFI